MLRPHFPAVRYGSVKFGSPWEYGLLWRRYVSGEGGLTRFVYCALRSKRQIWASRRWIQPPATPRPTHPPEPRPGTGADEAALPRTAPAKVTHPGAHPDVTVESGVGGPPIPGTTPITIDIADASSDIPPPIQECGASVTLIGFPRAAFLDYRVAKMFRASIFR